MQIELSEIKEIRKKYGLSQTELAKKAGVSQSLIAKIEAGRIDPTYSKTKRILGTLNDLRGEKELKAEEIMQKRIIYVKPHDRVREAISKMKKYGISQLPVLDNKKVIGLISETIILEKLPKIKPEESVEKSMEDAPPIITKNVGLSVVTDLLKHVPMVIVTEKGEIKGLITKSDLIRKIYKS